MPVPSLTPAPPTTARVWFLLQTARGTPLLRLHTPQRGHPTELALLVRACWFNLTFDYPGYSFERLTLAPERVTAVIRGPHNKNAYPPLRGIIAHFKAAVTRAAALGHPVWTPGYTVLAITGGQPGIWLSGCRGRGDG